LPPSFDEFIEIIVGEFPGPLADQYESDIPGFDMHA